MGLVLLVTAPFDHRCQQIVKLIPLLFGFVPRQFNNVALRMKIEHGRVWIGAMLVMVHQGIGDDLKQVIVGMIRRREFVIDDPVVIGRQSENT